MKQTIKVTLVSTPKNYKLEALKLAGLLLFNIDYISSESVEPDRSTWKTFAEYVNVPREYKVTIGYDTDRN